ncbi:MAG: zinc ribbon domain-containing protein [Acidobacteria bacterium]|nr:zinc ribbon domain-containing protein [Acidobacteriota bacterium]
MPLYEYHCLKGGHRFEQIQKFSDLPVKKCPTCGGKVERLVSPSAIAFKGSGWYVTDYARKGSPPQEKKPDKTEGGTDSKETKETKEGKETKDKKETKHKKED